MRCRATQPRRISRDSESQDGAYSEDTLACYAIQSRSVSGLALTGKITQNLGSRLLTSRLPHPSSAACFSPFLSLRPALSPLLLH